MNYIVVEIQLTASGECGVLATSFEGYEQALSSYYTVLAAAAISGVPKHSAFLLTPEKCLESKCFTHEGGGL